MKVILPKVMRGLIIWSGLLFAGLQAMTAQSGKDVSVNKFLQPVYKTIDGKTVTSPGITRQATPARTQMVTQQSDDLQDYLDNLAKSGSNALRANTTVVDLSQFQGTDRTRPLYVRNAANYTFINGTLSRNTALKDSAVLVLQQGAVVEWGDGAILSGGSFASGHELVLLEKGAFTVSSGTIKDSYCSSTRTFDDAIYLKEGTSFTMTGGLLYNTGGIANRYKGSLSILGGQIVGGGLLSLSDFILAGTANVSQIYVNLAGGAKILVKSQLHSNVDCVIVDSKAGLIVAAGTNNYTLTQSDLSKFIYSDPQSQQTKEWEYALTGGNIVLKEKSGFDDQDGLQKYIDEHIGKGTEQTPYDIVIPEKGIILTKPLTLSGGYWRFSGGALTFSGGYIVIGRGSHSWFEHIRFIWTGGSSLPDYWIHVGTGGFVHMGTGVEIGTIRCKYGIYIDEGGIVNMYSGTIRGCEWGIYNMGGTFNFYGGTISGNSIGGIYNGTGCVFRGNGGVISGNTKYDIYSYTCFWLGGSVNVGNIWLGKGACIYVTSLLKYKWQIYFIDSFEIGKTIVIGDGYTLGQGDITFITIYVPEIYIWYWDRTCGCIEIRENADGGIDTQEKLQKAINDATGTCNGNPTVIKLAGTIKVNGLTIENKSVKLEGGTLILDHSHDRPVLFKIKDACLTLERIVLDGDKAHRGTHYYSNYPPIQFMGISTLTINEETIIKNHYVDDDGQSGLINERIDQKSDKCTIIINGGVIYDNEIPNSKLVCGTSTHLIMNGGVVHDNLVSEIFEVSQFTMSGGSLKNNSTNQINLQTGIISSKAEFLGEKTTFRVKSYVALDGDAQLGGHTNVMLEGSESFIYISKTLKNDLTISHVTNAALSQPKAGTVIARGSHYVLTEADLARFSYENYKWSFALDKTANAIVLQAPAGDGIRTGDDLQDYLDKMAGEGKMGTEQEPEKVDKFVNPVKVDKLVQIPDGMHVKFLDGVLVATCFDCGKVISVPKKCTLVLTGTLVKGDSNKGVGGIQNIGKIIMNEESVIDYLDAQPDSKFILNGGTVGAAGAAGTCINIGKRTEISLQKGTIKGSVETESVIDWFGETKIDGNIYLKETSCKLRINSPLKSIVKCGYKSGTLLTPGTIVASGTDTYRLTQQDLKYLVPVDKQYSYELKNGNIVVSTATANENLDIRAVSASVSDGTIVLSGLTPGEAYAVYAMDGHVVCKEKATASTVYLPVPSRGMYLIRYKEITMKVVCTK